MAWPDAQIGAMDGKLAAKIMYDGQGADVINEKAAEYEALTLNVTSAATERICGPDRKCS